MGKFEVYKSKGQWYFRLKAGNGEIVAASEGYKTKQGALKGVASVQSNAGKSPITIIDRAKKTETTKRGLIKHLKKVEKDYDNKKLTNIQKSDDEIKDEKRTIIVNGRVCFSRKKF